jgi:hypothetical protein
MAMRRHHIFVLGILFCFQNNLLAAAVPELDMRTAYLYNFAQFAQWPENAHLTFNICTLGKITDSISPEILTNKTVNGRKIKLSRFPESGDFSDCQMVYLNTSDTAHATKLAKMLSKAEVLTIGEAEDGSTGPGIINLSVKKNRLVFDLDLAKARQANINLSSKLISLAQKVYE